MLRLLNRYEEVAHEEIKASADQWGLSVYPKVRLADVINLDGLGVVGELKRYGLQAHFDFLVCRDQWYPEFAVEFDGRYHVSPVQIARDQKKDVLCAKAGLPILRVNSRYLSPTFGSMSLLTWLMDVYELQLGFEKQQACGAIPPDEPFDPFFIISTGPNEDRFPYWFSAKPRIRLQQLHKRGVIIDPVSSGFIGYDANEVMRGIEYIRLTKATGLYVRTAMRPQQFPILMSDLLDEILSVQLADRVFAWTRGEVAAIAMSDIHRIAAEMEATLTIGRAHGYGRAVG